MLLVGIREGQATIDPRGVLECVVLLDHGRLLALPISEHATYGVKQLQHFMASHQDELRAAHVNRDCAFAEWAGLKEHMVKHFANVHWPLAPHAYRGLGQDRSTVGARCLEHGDQSCDRCRRMQYSINQCCRVGHTGHEHCSATAAACPPAQLRRGVGL